jgi:hypothetical protein
VDSQIVEIATRVTAVGLTFGSFVLLLTGSALTLGTSFRTAVEPVLRSIRDLTSMSRPDLADTTVVAAIGFAGCSAVFESVVAGMLIMGLLAWSRPMVRRATRDENKLQALAGSFSIDLIIGGYLPIVPAQALLGNWYAAASLLLVTLALSWPAGGGRRVPGTWRLAPVAP